MGLDLDIYVWYIACSLLRICIPKSYVKQLKKEV